MRQTLLLTGIVAALALAAFAIPGWAGAFGGGGEVGRAPAEAAPQGAPVGPAPDGPLSVEERDALAAEAKQFLSCMRERGFDLPDPVVSSTAVAISLDGVSDHEALFAAGEQCGAPGPPPSG